MKEKINFIKDLLGKNDTDQAIEELSKLLKNDDKLNDVILQSSRANRLEDQVMAGIVTYNDANLTQNNVTIALLNICDDIINEIETRQNSIDKSSKKPQKSDLIIYDNELVAHEDIKKEILKSKNIKLYCIRGSKLLKENEGLFDLVKYNLEAVKPNEELMCKILLLDYYRLSEDQYESLQQNILINWRGLQIDKDKLTKTIERIKVIDRDYYCQVKLYNANMFQHIKMFIFDDSCYFTFYHKKGRTKKHQQNDFFKVNRSNPMYSTLNTIFDTSWENSKIVD